MVQLNEIPIALTSDKVKIAIAQLESPLPDGKIIGVLPSGRETYVWSNKEQIEKRMAKARKILEFLHEQHPETEVVVFPEYSLPIAQQSVRQVLQEFSDNHKIIIIGGADNIPDSDWEKIYNKCPIFIPNEKEPVWIIKQHLSKWENRYIDEDTTESYQNPVLSWSANGKKHYISVHICLDFTYFMRSQLFDANVPIVRIVPMCSPDMNLLRGYADLSLTEDGERSVILCNCIGKGSVGKSSIFLVSPDGERLKAAYEYEDDSESIVYFEINCSRLIPPKKSTSHTRDALENVHHHKIYTSLDGIEIYPFVPKPPARMSRAIINPAIFQHFNKIMRVAFIGVEAYGTLNNDDISKPGFECYSILGHGDMMITHLHQNSGAMLFDITNTIPGFKSSTGGSFDGAPIGGWEDTARFPFFEVTAFHKVLGVKVTEQNQHAFDRKPLDPQELRDLLVISKNWNDEIVSEKTKKEFFENGWILGQTTEEPGDIDAVMTIYLNDPDNVDRALRDFENRILPKLIEKTHITSLYEGTGRRISTHYFLRIKCSREQLFSFISDVHSIAALDKFSIKTSTFVIVKKWSSLDLEKNLSHNISPEVDKYIKGDLAPFLEESDREQLNSLDEEELRKIVDEHKNLGISFRILEKRKSFSSVDKIKRMNQAMTIGLAKQDVRLLSVAHDELQGRVEEILRDLTNAVVTPDYFEQVRDITNIPKGKILIGKLTYAELLKLAMQCVKDGLLDSRLLEPLQNLFAKTKDVRNQVKHSDFAELTMDAMLQALNQYCAFLVKWDS
jgi:predicted amidohydrolase